jgi:hypothetical protein
LQRIFDQGFALDPVQRTWRVQDLVDELVVYVARHAGRRAQAQRAESTTVRESVAPGPTLVVPRAPKAPSGIEIRQLQGDTSSSSVVVDLGPDRSDPEAVASRYAIAESAARPSMEAPRPDPLPNACVVAPSEPEPKLPSKLGDSPEPLLERQRAPGAPQSRAWIATAVIASMSAIVSAGALVYVSSKNSAQIAPTASASSPPAPVVAPAGISSDSAKPAARSIPIPIATGSAFSDDDASACIVGHLPAGTFRVPQDMTFVCSEVDPRRGSARIRTRIVAARDGQFTDGMNEWPRLGWYELAAYSILRGRCCPGAAALQLPAVDPPCDPLGPVLERLAQAATSNVDVELRVLAFEKSAICVHNSKSPSYAYAYPPYGGSQYAFGWFLKRVFPSESRDR